VVEVELEDDVVPFGSFIQRFLGVPDYMGAATLANIYVVDVRGSCICGESKCGLGASRLFNMYPVEAVGPSGSTSTSPILLIYRLLPQKPYQWPS
jgi:hypothetical protein